MGSSSGQTHLTGPDSCTPTISRWVDSLSLADVPDHITTRIKYLMLDSLACGFIGTQLPWSKVAAQGIFDIESSGSCSVLRWSKKLTPLSAALLNSTFIQGLELDDYHSKAPIHSGSIIVPVLLALVQHLSAQNPTSLAPKIDGASFLQAAIVGYELGPRVGLGLYGVDALTRGWHSGAIFGPAAAAAAASKLMQLPFDKVEDAIGIACTQAGGLMSAQYESMVKRMQHGFAARNGLFAALMAKNNYIGIKQVLERPYGGFLSNFSRGNERDPPSKPDAITAQLGQDWEISNIIVKPYASMAATHVPIDCIRALQEECAQTLNVDNLPNISQIIVEMSEPAWKKGGWKATKPITMTGAQMNASYAMSLQLLDNKVTASQFLDDEQLNRPDLWDIIEKIECRHNPDFDPQEKQWTHRVSVMVGGRTISKLLDGPRSQSEPVPNEEVLEKWRVTTEGILSPDEQKAIGWEVLHLEKSEDVMKLVELLMGAGGRLDQDDDDDDDDDDTQGGVQATI